MTIIKKLPLPLLLAMLFLLAGCNDKTGSFLLLNPGQTHINFANKIFESDSINIFDFSNIYNGGGVGVGDFNNDGLQDLYFTGNMVPNKLYLNEGSMKFKDVTEASQTSGSGNWSRGVAVVDINNDGLMDLYVCATARHNPMERKNILYVNQGTDKDHIPHFKNLAAEYGLEDTTQSTMAYFFDYDNDGDLDLYIAVNHIIQDEYANTFKKRNINGEHPSTGKLYRNDWNGKLGHPVYSDVSRAAGILIEGYSHAADIFDVNNDGWQDILVTNDYISNNVLYINNHDGTFTDHIKEYFKHTAANSMGSDAIDLNNDGLDDVIEVDMAPQDNLRKKMFQNAVSYQVYQNSDRFGYQYQYTRNMLQVNQGPSIGFNDSIGHPVFADEGFFAGVAETDWSWTPLVADFDNNGFRDIVFTNGFPKDITDHDFITFRNEAFSLTSKKDMLSEIPQVKIHNYIYKNNGNMKFADKTGNWGMETISFSNGAVYADLDNDGDQDVVINNIEDPAMIYENNIVQAENNRFLDIRLQGSAKNSNGIGARIIVYQKTNIQYLTNNPYRGYISSVSPVVHFGFGTEEPIDSVVVLWPGNLKQVLKNVKSRQVLKIAIKDASPVTLPPPATVQSNTWFTNITPQTGLDYVHEQTDFVDFNIQKLLPHKFSEYAPGMAAGDINGDGLDDFITGGAPGKSAMIFSQRADNTFSKTSLLAPFDSLLKKSDDRGLLLFDADGDGDRDLYISSGGYSYAPGDSAYQDHFYINDGRGKYIPAPGALPAGTGSKFCVRACDYDKDGDLDLFVAGRLDPQFYPRPVSSFIYRNDSKNGKVLFTDITSVVAPDLQNIGLCCDAIFSDYDNDGWTDLVLAGEWMPVTFLHNEKGKFVNVTKSSGAEMQTGLWNSLIAADFDHDGDIDFVAGNIGLNSFYRATPDMPVKIYAKDFDNNGSYDAIPALYLPATLEAGTPWLEFPAHGRDDMVKQMIGTRKIFQNYKSYAVAPMSKILTAEQLKGAVILKADYLSSAYIENKGNGTFKVSALPAQAQLSALNGMFTGDFDGDGHPDILMATNDYGTDPSVGRYDALNGIVLRGDGKGGFTCPAALQSGLFLPGNGKAIVAVKTINDHYELITSQNRGPLQVLRPNRNNSAISFAPDDLYATVTYKDGSRQKQENYYGASFLSQGSGLIPVGNLVTAVSITNGRGRVRSVDLTKLR